jgi:hypothetical protein
MIPKCDNYEAISWTYHTETAGKKRENFKLARLKGQT